MESDDGSVKVRQGGMEGENRPVGSGGGAVLRRCAGARAGIPSMLVYWIMRFTSFTSATACTLQAHADTRTSLALFPQATSVSRP